MWEIEYAVTKPWYLEEEALAEMLRYTKDRDIIISREKLNSKGDEKIVLRYSLKGENDEHKRRIDKFFWEQIKPRWESFGFGFKFLKYISTNESNIVLGSPSWKKEEG